MTSGYPVQQWGSAQIVLVCPVVQLCAVAVGAPARTVSARPASIRTSDRRARRKMENRKLLVNMCVPPQSVVGIGKPTLFARQREIAEASSRVERESIEEAVGRSSPC